MCVCAEFYSAVALGAARRACAAADAVIVVGTSLSVYPAAELPQLARRHNPGALLIEINAVHAVRLFGFRRSPSMSYFMYFIPSVLFIDGTPRGRMIDDNVLKATVRVRARTVRLIRFHSQAKVYPVYRKTT